MIRADEFGLLFLSYTNPHKCIFFLNNFFNSVWLVYTNHTELYIYHKQFHEIESVNPVIYFIRYPIEKIEA